MAPTGSVDIIFSSYAQHWLSGGVPFRLPAKTGALWGNQLAGLAEYEDIHNEWSKASQKDWDRFLSLRADELRPNGIMVLLLYSSHHNGKLVESISDSCQIAKRQCVKEGIFTEQEAEKMCVPEYAKSVFEILNPLNSQREWEILEIQHGSLPCALMTTSSADVGGDCIQTQKMVNLARSFMDASLERAFSRDTKESKLNQFWAKVMEIGVDDPSKISTNFGSTFLVLRRTCY